MAVEERVEREPESGAPTADVRLEFGSKATFLAGAKVGSLSCDGSQLVRGPMACSPETEAKPSVAKPETSKPGAAKPNTK